MKEGDRLQVIYPGPNAEQIADQLTGLAASWQELKDATLARRNLLVASYDLQKFFAQTRDFVGWTHQANMEMQSEQRVRDLQSAEWIQQEHHRLKAEIDARQPECQQIKAQGAELLAQKHYASAEIEEKSRQLLEAYELVNREWTLRNEWVEQVRRHIVNSTKGYF